MVWEKIFIFKGFLPGCQGNQNSSWNTIIWRNFKEDHLRNIPVKFGKNPVNSFWGEVFGRKSLQTRTYERTDRCMHRRTNARRTQGHDNTVFHLAVHPASGTQRNRRGRKTFRYVHFRDALILISVRFAKFRFIPINIKVFTFSIETPVIFPL